MRIKGVTTGLLKRIKESLFDMVTSRLLLLFIIFIAMAAVLIYRIFDLQIVNGESYLNNFQLKIQKEKIIEGTRGNIYDRNGRLLAYNELAYSVTIEDVYESGSEKNSQLNGTLYKLIHLIEDNGDSVISDFNIILRTTNMPIIWKARRCFVFWQIFMDTVTLTLRISSMSRRPLQLRK